MSSIWRLPNRIELNYARTLRALARQIGTALGNDPDPLAAVRRLRLISQHPPYIEHCNAVAMLMTTHIQTRVNGSWRTAAQRAGRGSELYRDIMQELSNMDDAFLMQVRTNAWYIKTFPRDIARELTDYIQSESMKGRRAYSIAKELQEIYDEKSIARMNLIARTETSKTQTALTQARAESIGISWYVWRTSEDARVRNSHEHMEGVLIKWSDPPNPEALDPNAEQKPYGSYHAGETFNCRCYPEPVVSLDFLDFPMQVYHSGSIQRMTKAQFENITA